MKKGMSVLLVAALVGGGMSVAYADRDGYESHHEYGERHHGKEGKHCKKGGKFRIEKMREHLGLSDEQVKKMESIREKFKPKMQALREKSKANRAKLREAKHADKVNMSEIKALAKAQGELKTQKIILKAEKRQAIHAVLTKEQLSKMQEMRKQHRENRGDDDRHHGMRE
jgi:Spy/CpxP family protein refolding chaperone